MLSHPGRVIERAWAKLKALANPATFPVRFLQQGRYGPVKDSTVQAVTLLTIGPFVIVTLLAVAALWLGPRSPERRLTALILGFFLAAFAITFGMSRYRLPLMPLLSIHAASILTDPARLLSEARSPLRWLGLLATLACLACAWALYLPLIFDVF